MNIKFQEPVLNLIDHWTLSSLPNTILIEGKQGAGKHLICSYIAEKFNFPLLDITTNLNLDFISECYLRTTPFFYLVDLDKITEKEQNVILKFLEEPLKNSFILLITSDKLNQLPTVLNRCYLISLSPYSKEQLMEFTSDNNILEFSDTPGDIISLSNNPLQEYIELAEKIVTKIKVATFPNALTLIDKISVDDKDSGIPLHIMVKILKKVIIEGIKENKPYDYAFIPTLKLEKQLNIKNINKKDILSLYILTLWKLSRGE